jgi:hypothetical protein
MERKSSFIFYQYSALGPVWAGTRAQSGDRYGSGTLHPGHVLRGSLPLLSPKSSLYRRILLGMVSGESRIVSLEHAGLTWI